MARVVVYSMAYRGDVHPYAPVATELANRGHDVTFVVPREFHAEFASEPFRCVHSGSDFSPSELNQHGEWLAKWGMRFGGARLLELYLGQFTIPHLEAQFDALAAELEGADVLFAHSTAGVVGSMACEALHVPWISGDLFPMLIPTRTANPLPQVPSLGSWGNRLAWKLARSTRPDRLSMVSGFVDFRRRKGLDHRRRSMIDMRISPHLNLGMVSPHYLPPAPDWPDNYSLTGFTHWENAAGRVPDDLDDFLDAGDPPLLITLGTLGAATHPERFDAAVAAAEQAGRRTVSLCSLDATVDRIRSTWPADRHGAWTFAPLSKVLPRVCAVVHSGSHGTNSMALEAGLPSVIMPSIFDQVWHAHRQVELGTGVHVRRERELQAAVNVVLTDSSMGERAQAFGARLDDGTPPTADRIEQFLATG